MIREQPVMVADASSVWGSATHSRVCEAVQPVSCIRPPCLQADPYLQHATPMDQLLLQHW